MRARRERPQMKPRPLQISDDSHDRSLFSRPRDIIMNQVIVSHGNVRVDSNSMTGVEPDYQDIQFRWEQLLAL